jgi:hypothetical protein
LLASGTRALAVDGDLHAGREWFEAAYREGESTGDARVMAEAALGVGGWWPGEDRSAAAYGLLDARLRHALTLADPASSDAIRIRLRLAAEADYRTGSHIAVLAALEEVRGLPDPAVHAEALRLAHHCLLGPDHGELRRTLANELIGKAALVDSRGDSRGVGRGHLLMGLLYQTVDLFFTGHPHAYRRLAELRAELDRGEHLAVGYVVSAIEVMLAIRAGRLDDAERLAEDCVEHGGKAGDGDAAAWHGAHTVAIRWYQGRLPELLPTLAGLVHSPDLSAVDHSFHAAHAVAAAAAGDHPAAMRAMAYLLQPTLTDLPRSGTWLATMYGFVEAANLIGNEPAAATAYRRLVPYADLPAMASLAITCFGSVHHALGVAALTTGELDRAVAHLRRAVHRNLALGHWPAVLSSRLRLAEALDRRGTDDDKAAAREERDHAATVAARLHPQPRPHQSGGFGIRTRDLGTQGSRTEESRTDESRVVEAEPHAPAGLASCRRIGRGWRIELGSRAAHVEHSIGMLHLAVLIANPGTEVTSADLVAGVNALSGMGRGRAEQPLLDRAAIRQYRQRLAELDARDGGGAEDGDDDQTRREHDWLMAELTVNTRPGGRSRAFTDDSERARLAAGRAIRRALVRIDQADTIIGAHLRDTIHTGIRCWYRPL